MDRAAGVIRGVSVVTVGEAKGHGKFADAELLKQVMTCAQGFSNGIKVKANHGSGVMEIIGTLGNFVSDDTRLSADLTLFKTSRDYDQILDMAERIPDQFGLSIAFSGEDEVKDGQRFARCTELYSVDLVDDPAANPNGLFSTKTSTTMPTIELTEFAKLVGLPDMATKDQVMQEWGKRLASANTPPAATLPPELKQQFDALTEQVKTLTTSAAQAQAFAKKAEIDNLMASASAAGKIVPLEALDLYEVKDGFCTIKMEPSALKRMVEKLPGASVAFSRRSAVQPPAKDGKRLTGDDLKQFCREKRAEGGEALTQMFATRFGAGATTN